MWETPSWEDAWAEMAKKLEQGTALWRQLETLKRGRAQEMWWRWVPLEARVSEAPLLSLAVSQRLLGLARARHSELYQQEGIRLGSPLLLLLEPARV